ncbi:MAG: SRPBCC domain-containing protein [Gaiellaceae bacterium]
MELRVEREVVFPADPAEVWEALTEPDRLEEWFATEAELDPVPGGEGVFRWGDGDERRAVVREAEPEERLVLDWDDGGEVVLELEEVEGGTRVHVTETSPDFAAALELHALAWAQPNYAGTRYRSFA